jgi:hypothetical protein
VATNIAVKQVTQVGLESSVAKARIDFLVLGIPPDVVQIWAAGVSDNLGRLVEQVEITPTENDYSALIDLPAGNEFFIHLCPREQEKGVLQDEIDGQPWETFCTMTAFTTKASLDATPRPKPPAPRIGLIDPHQPTLTGDARIVVHWTAVTDFDQYHFMWREQPHGFTEIEIESGGRSGFFTVQPVSAGRTYSFKVQGCIVHLIGLNDCSPFSEPVDFVMPQYVRSLGQFIKLSLVTLKPGIRSLGSQVVSHGIRAMMRL